MTTLDFANPQTRTSSASRLGVASVQLGDDLWRITLGDGEVLGYVERHATPAGSRFTAKRMLQRQRRFMPIGDFWTIDDALECFRF